MVLAVVLVILKMTGTEPFVYWSWVWVLAPIWIGFAVFLFLLLAILAAYLFAKVFNW